MERPARRRWKHSEREGVERLGSNGGSRSLRNSEVVQPRQRCRWDSRIAVTTASTGTPYTSAICRAAPTTEFSEGERADVAWIQTAAIDLAKEIVIAASFRDDLYNANPIVTLNHSYYEPPIGRSLWRKKVEDTVNRPDKLAHRRKRESNARLRNSSSIVEVPRGLQQFRETASWHVVVMDRRRFAHDRDVA
jgi:hypothetical protein